MSRPRRWTFVRITRGRLMALLVLVGLFVLRVADPGFLQSLRESSFDLYRVLEGDRAAIRNADVLVVAIDERSLVEFGQWPWPRDLLARLLERIAEDRPRAVGLNVLLPDPDRMSPRHLAEQLDELPARVRRELLRQPSADERLAAALADVPVVLAMAVTSDPAHSRNAGRLGPLDVVFAGSAPPPELPAYRGIVRSMPLFTKAASGEGVVNFDVGGGQVRRLPSVVRVGNMTLPSLALEMVKVGRGADQIVVRAGPVGVESVSVGASSHCTDRAGYLRVRFVQPRPGSQLSAAAVLKGEVPAGIFQGKYVVLGASASGLAESYATPVAGTLTGIQLHAQLLGSLLASSSVARPAWSTGLELVFLAVSGLLLISLVPMLRPAWEVALLFGTVAALGVLGLGAYLAAGVLIDVSFPIFTCITAYVLLASIRLIAEERGSREFSGRMRILESTLDSVPVPVVVCSLLDDSILYANASAREDLTLGQGASVPDGMSAVLDRSQDWEVLINRLHLEGRVDGFEAFMNGTEGRIVALLAARKLYYQGQDAALVACVDITERKRMENELRASRDEAQQANERLRDAQANLVQAEKLASLGGLVAGVAHEINTPVGIGLAGASHILDRSRALRRVFEEHGLRRSAFVSYLDTVEETAELVAANVQRAADLIQGFKRVSVDQASEQRQVFDLEDYLRDVVMSLSAELNRTGSRVEVDCPEGITLDSYPGAIALIITNFVMNSLTHAFERGDRGLIRIMVRSIDDDVELRCSDNGKGMPQEVASRIFDPFFTTRRGRGGSGLGLYLVFNTVTQVLRGRIEVASEEGRGTTFVVRFPRVATSADAEAAGKSTVRVEEQSSRP